MFKLSLCWNVFEGFKGLIICKKTIHYRIENQFIFLSIIFFLLKISTKFSIECTFHFSIFVFVFFFFALYFFFVIVRSLSSFCARRASLAGPRFYSQNGTKWSEASWQFLFFFFYFFVLSMNPIEYEAYHLVQYNLLIKLILKNVIRMASSPRK